MTTLGATWTRPDVAWTEELVAKLRALHADTSLSYAAIAHRLGITRNAVSGKVDRLGLAKRAPTGGRQGGKPRLRPARSTPFRLPPSAPQGLQAPQRAPVARSEPPGLIPLVELDARACRWPSGDGSAGNPIMFCGKTRVEGLPYCSAHGRMAYQAGNSRR